MPARAAGAVSELGEAQRELILSASRQMSEEVEARWRAFMALMRRPPRGLLLGPRGQGVASASSPAVAALNSDGAAAEEEDMGVPVARE